MPPTPQRRATDNDIIVQEINDYLAKNNLSEGEKLKWRVMKLNYIDGLAARKHIECDEKHTPKGLLLRKEVIGWAVFIMVLVAVLVMYVPDGIAWLKALP